jgi:hypothetical protein
MKRSFVGMGIALLLITPAAWAQSATGDTGSDAGGLADNPPAENVRGGAVRERAPGRIIDFARARHRELSESRLGAQRSGETSALAAEPLAGGSSGSLTSLLGGSISDLISTFLGSGVAGGLGGMLGGTGTTDATGAAAGGSAGGDLSNLPPEVIQMLTGAGISLSDLSQKTREDTSQVSAGPSKTTFVAQDSGVPQERSFKVRWADAMLSTIFTSAAVGFQTQDFIDVLKDLFRPLFTPPDTDSDAGDGTPTGDGTGSGDGSSGDGDSTGDGDGDEPLI